VKDVGPESCGQPTPCWPSPALEPVLGKASQHLGLENGQPLCLLELNWGGTECVLSSTGRTAACFLPITVYLPGRPGTTGSRLLLPTLTLLQDTTRWCWMLVLWSAKVQGHSPHGILRDQATGIGFGKGFHPDHCPSQVPRKPHHTPFPGQGKDLVLWRGGEHGPGCVRSVEGVLWGKRCGFKVCVCRGWV
uniref:Uncharacterized protein n=1 Tax=Rhinopithecus roxellana TaxID=61622 RepID=A0A2K6PCY2_RHIRO